MDEKNRVSSISQSQSLEEMAAFWDDHDATAFAEQTHEVEMSFELSTRRHYVAIDPSLLSKLRDAATTRGLNTESLINLWLQERLLTTQV